MKDVNDYYNEEVCVVLGTALLYFMFTPDGKNVVPSFLLQSVQQEFYWFRDRELQENSIEKIALVAHGSDGEVFWDEIVAEETQGFLVGGEARANDDNFTSERSATHQLRAIQSQLSSLNASLLSLRERVIAMECRVDSKITGVQWNLKRLAYAPGRHIRPPTVVLYLEVMIPGLRLVYQASRELYMTCGMSSQLA